MANRNKNKGDRAERAVRDWAVERYPGSFKTRAGFTDDLGDIIMAHYGGRVGLQVKDVATPTWTQWFTQLAGQVATLIKESPGRVLGGVIVHKARGTSNPGAWRAVVGLEELADLMDATYQAGLEDGRAGLS